MTFRNSKVVAMSIASVMVFFIAPQGSKPSFIERFHVSDDRSRLRYELTATDEEVFTAPVTVKRDWVWRPGEEVKPYDCDETA